jgi:hypothetical protein
MVRVSLDNSKTSRNSQRPSNSSPPIQIAEIPFFPPRFDLRKVTIEERIIIIADTSFLYFRDTWKRARSDAKLEEIQAGGRVWSANRRWLAASLNMQHKDGKKKQEEF